MFSYHSIGIVLLTRGIDKITLLVLLSYFRIRYKYSTSNRFIGKPLIDKHKQSFIKIGERNLLISKSRHTALGVTRPVILRTTSPGANISVGNDNGFSGTVICANYSVEIGNGCLFGSETMIFDTDFHPVNLLNRRYRPVPKSNAIDRVLIEDDVFIGARSTILKGVRMGKGSVIGAGSVVASDIPEFSVAAGNPCEVVRRLK